MPPPAQSLGLLDLLNDDDFRGTILAPTDKAFETLLGSLPALPDVDVLTEIVVRGGHRLSAACERACGPAVDACALGWPPAFCSRSEGPPLLASLPPSRS